MSQSSAPIPSVVALLAVAGGLAAANLYYSQPLLPSIAVDLGIPIGRIGFLPATTQIGFAIGILAVLPLADMLERRRLIVTMLVLIAAALAIQAAAATAAVAFAAALFVGLFGVAPQLMTPFSAVLAPKGREGAAVGMVLSGILGGVLVSKLLAGFVAAGAGWRALYWAASAVTLVLAAVLRVYLPKSRPAPRPSYFELLRSSARIVIEEPDLRRHALYGGLTFASFMTFWSTYAIDLQDVFGFGPAVAGLFGAVGLAGSVGASIAGRQIDRGRFALICMTAAALMIGGFLILMWGEQSVAWIVIGVLLMDFGAGLSHSANQSSAFALRPEARGRINSATLAYSTGGWRLTERRTERAADEVAAHINHAHSVRPAPPASLGLNSSIRFWIAVSWAAVFPISQAFLFVAPLNLGRSVRPREFERSTPLLRGTNPVSN